MTREDADNHASGLKDTLKNALIVSCQPVPGGAMDDSQFVVAFALAAMASGASALRIESARYVAAVRAATDAPVIGLIKRDLADSPVRITPFLHDVAALAEAGADIIAFDATDRIRPVSLEDLAQAVRDAGKLSMADCSCIDDARRALAAGVDFVGSTMSGYTGGPEPVDPDIVLVAALRELTPHVIAEGRIRTLEQAQAAARAGAACVVVGSAITRTEHVTAWFREALDEIYSPAPVVLAVDLGGTKIMASLVQSDQVLDSLTFATDRNGGPEGWLASIAEAVKPWAGRYTSAGIAVTGAVRHGHWRAMNKATLGIEGEFPLEARAKDLLGLPVMVVNDAQAAAWGEFKAKADQSDLVFITVSTGLGGGIVSGGHLLRGVAGHFGQMRGSSGSDLPLESQICGPWIAAEAKRLGHECDPKAVFEAAQSGQDWANGIVNGVAKRFALLCCDIQLSIDPARIVVGGGVGLATGFLEKVRAEIIALAPSAIPYVEAATLGSKAGIIGIADLAIAQ
ncbi:putative N-acetylmannosamine-6-phosphate 2-epimerase [Agrobacterium rosae]|uniref:Putative N-acetylmannosamine-6-phosphate 2-epimerase n=1 Tax=Agrobacterium rosae TaxID=1972867 RepID=A0AAE5VM03_9HYPH|nr:putative N-acetylmannosamine-6-phosphate 2-epimerase [Agrobacterium rosae]KAA3507493.1 ROK family protein [Agrobacterium rosae]KAA3511983.1 ROK family protein [Agrobacterium rosae]MBN7804532.1 putative N-acetylmannosamine-6-phosphate 2-epimerase [Agrobacterium rosae]MCM2435548.1 putative N-acetylmannosamine-6-phosphate 2-epimerase [Agrobacterium rosae]MDX8332334.1 putative N-acetylmannosamine-6-phosphate 2-epimerase [Agrobacterium rosae]